MSMHNHSLPRPASEYSSPSGRPLSCVVDENTPVMTPVNGAEASCPPGEPRIQERRVRSQRHRNYMSRTHLHTPPDLPEGYGERQRRHTHNHIHPHFADCLPFIQSGGIGRNGLNKLLHVISIFLNMSSCKKGCAITKGIQSCSR